MGKKIVAFVVILVAFLVLAFKQYVYTFILGTDLDSSHILKGGVFALLFAIIIALILLVNRKPNTDLIKKEPTNLQQTAKTFFTVQFAIGAFVFYLVLLVMRLVLFIDMYTVSPVMMMVEFTLITIVALMLFLPHLVDRIGKQDKTNENQ